MDKSAYPVNYAIYDGFVFIFILVIIISFIITILISFALKQVLIDQDESIRKEKKAANFGIAIIKVIKNVILWIFGYNGPEREKTAAEEVDNKWVKNARLKIFSRLASFYIAYIFVLVMLFRPVYYNGEHVQAFSYNTDIPELVSIFIAYVVSNAIFDYWSLKITFSNMRKAEKSRKYLRYFSLDLIIATIIFCISQAFSCVLWLLKRDTYDTSSLVDERLSNSLFEAFIDISLWPYAFFNNANTDVLDNQFFLPGQMLITGTIYFPTMIVAIIFITYYIFFKFSFSIKSVLFSMNRSFFEKICTGYVILKGMDVREARALGICNVALLSVLYSVSGLVIIAAVTILSTVIATNSINVL